MFLCITSLIGEVRELNSRTRTDETFGRILCHCVRVVVVRSITLWRRFDDLAAPALCKDTDAESPLLFANLT